jgi:sulfur carrier protein ThiS
MAKQDIKDLARLYAYGECSSEELLELERLLTADGESREVFLSELNIHSSLDELAIVNMESCELSSNAIFQPMSRSLPTRLSDWAVSGVIALALLLLLFSIFWARGVGNNREQDNESAQVERDELPTELQDREQKEKEESVFPVVDHKDMVIAEYPLWILDKKILTREELDSFERSLITGGVDREDLPKWMAVIVKLAAAGKGKSQEEQRERIDKLLDDFGFNAEQGAIAENLSQRLKRNWETREVSKD